MGSKPIAAGWKSPPKCRRKPIKNVSSKAKMSQPKDGDAYANPYVACARPKRSTTKKDQNSPPDNSTDDKSSASESQFSPQ
jgi:hypothetical protein